MSDRFISWLAIALVVVIRRLPLAVCFALGQGLGALLWLILPGYRQLATENLTIAFGGEKSPREIAALAFRHFVTLGANAVSAFKTAALSEGDILRVAPIEHLDPIRKNIAKGRGVVLAINHIGNWELYAQLVFQVPEARFGAVYQALRNRYINELVNRDRRRLGVATFDRKRGFQGALALIREPGVVGVLVDQSAGDGGVWMPFFNRLASTSPLAATLAIRTGAAVVPVAIYTSGFARWRVVLSEEIPYDPTQPDQLTADINLALERQIRESPADWFWVHNRWKTPLPNFLTAGQKRGTWLPQGADGLQKFPMVVRSPNWLGDAVMSCDAVRAFKLGRPDAHLAVLTPAKLADWWKAVPEVDEVISIEADESIFATARKIRGRFRVGILFPNSLRSALELWWAGVPRRVGYRGHARAGFLNQEVVAKRKRSAPARPIHHADRYWRIAQACGATTPPPALSFPRRVTAAPVTLGVCPGAEYGPAKRWPAERFREAMATIGNQIACRWVLFGTRADAEIADEIARDFSGELVNLAGRTSLKELIDHLQTVSVLLTNDTGTMHLADALGVPLVAIFGSTEPAHTGPRRATSTVLRRHVECSPCFLRECPLDFRCMKAVSPRDAADAVLAVIGTKAQ